SIYSSYESSAESSRWKDALVIVKPETLVGCYRACFRRYWRWKSRPRAGRTRITEEMQAVVASDRRGQPGIRDPLWRKKMAGPSPDRCARGFGDLGGRCLTCLVDYMADNGN